MGHQEAFLPPKATVPSDPAFVGESIFDNETKSQLKEPFVAFYILAHIISQQAAREVLWSHLV